MILKNDKIAGLFNSFKKKKFGSDQPMTFTYSRNIRSLKTKFDKAAHIQNMRTFSIQVLKVCF